MTRAYNSRAQTYWQFECAQLLGALLFQVSAAECVAGSQDCECEVVVETCLTGKEHSGQNNMLHT